jgi:hypothetical protein
MNNNVSKVQKKIFKDLLHKHQDSIKAVSSESLAHKNLRYAKISELFSNEKEIEVHDIGFGLAHYYTYLKRKYPKRKITYSGTEILKDFITLTKKKYPDNNYFYRDLSQKPGKDKYDYLILSGIFHQRQKITIPNRENFSQELIKNAFIMCRKAIAFNFVSPFVDYYQNHIYYSNLLKLIYFINDNLSRFFSILHNYPLYEFTVYVYRENYIKHKYNEEEFVKYFKS